MKTTHSAEPAGPQTGTLAAYALPAMVFAIPTIPVAVHLPSFYAEDLGLGLAITGGILTAARVLDVVTDPLIGVLSDRWRTRFGRRKPWIVPGAIVAGLSLFALFSPPQTVSAAYLALWAVLLFLGWTMISIPYNAWGAELSDSYDGRTRITTAREALGIVGILLAASAPFALSLIGFDDEASRQGVVWIALLLGVPTVAALIWMVPERHQKETPKAHLSFRTGAAVIAGNRPFRRLLLAWFANGLANGLPAVLLPLYLGHVLAVEPVVRNGLIFLYFLSAVVALPLWLRLSHGWSKHKAWCAVMLGAVAAFSVVPFIGAGDVVAFAIVCMLTGAALGADLAIPPAMQADVIDIDRLRTGRERAGLFFALWGMATKLALAVAVGVAFPVLDLAGFEPGAVNDEHALAVLVGLYAALPILLKLGAIALVWRHPLTRRRHEALHRRLDRRMASAKHATKGPAT